MDLEAKILELKNELTAALQAGSTKTAAEIAELKTQLAKLQRQADALDVNLAERHAAGGSAQGGGADILKTSFEESAEFAHLKELGRGRAIIKIKDFSQIRTKTLVSESAVGWGTPGVINPQPVGGIVPLAQRRLFVRDLLFKGNRISTGAAFFISEASFTNAASPQTSEGATKGESGDTFTPTTRQTATIAHWLPISRQLLDDMPSLFQFIQTKLLYGLRYKEEVQFLSGDGLGANLSGLIPYGTAFDTTLRGTNWVKPDILRRALQQVERTDEVPAGFFVMHPDDWADCEVRKDSYGRYLLDPRASNTPSLWGRPVVVSTAIASGSFLAGSAESAEIFDRMDATIEISLDHEDYRSRNLAMILVECRTVLCIYRPLAFIHGSLSSSP